MKILNDNFANVVITFAEHYRIIIGNGDLRTVSVERGERFGKKRIWVALTGLTYRLDAPVSPREWIKVSIEFNPEFKPGISRFYIRLLYPLKSPILQKIEVPFRSEDISEDWHRIGIGHLNLSPSIRRVDQTSECSSIMLRDFEIYGPLRRSVFGNSL